jgi:protein TonB
VRPRWLIVSVVVHATAIGCCIAWFGFATEASHRRPLVKLELAREDETTVAEESIVVAVEHPPPLEDSPFVEIVPPRPADPGESEEPEEDPPVFEDSCDPRPRDEPSAEDWLAVIRRPKPVVVPEPPAAPTIVRTRVAPTPIAGKNPPPKYPPRAEHLGIHGTVTLSVDVDADGRVVACRVETSSGSRLLDAAAERAVRGWRFRDGPGTVLVPVVFTLGRRVR